MNKTKNILIIDDDIMVLESIKNQLKDNDFNLNLVDDPLLGIEKIKTNNYDLVISDIKMKTMTGLEVLEYIKSNFTTIRVIIITGYIDDILIEEAKRLGSDDFLVKPIRKKILLDSINQILN